MIDLTPYQEHGFASRTAYLKDLAEEYGIELSAVLAIATLLGEDEDFDGLVSALGDMRDGLYPDYPDYQD